MEDVPPLTPAPPLVTIKAMKKKKRAPGALGHFLKSPFLNLYWGGLAAVVWTGAQVWHVDKGSPFSILLFLKGLLLLALATAAYQFSVFAKGPSFLGLFPLLWLSVSRFQWDLCRGDDWRPWSWSTLFLASEILLFKVLDGKKLFFTLAPIWILMTHFFLVSILMPLAFLIPFSRRSGNYPWVRWGGLGLVLGLVLAFKPWDRFNLIFASGSREAFPTLLYFLAAWFLFLCLPILWLRKTNRSLLKKRFLLVLFPVVSLMPFFVLAIFLAFGGISQAPLYELLITGKFIGFFLLGWLGWVAFPPKENYRFALQSVLFLLAGYLVWAAFPQDPRETGLVSWVLIWAAGFGWESVRRDLMDPSWHGRLLWMMLGAMFFFGVV